MPPTIVITGVSTGIGHAAAAAFLKRGYTVFGTVRQPSEAQALARAWGASFRALLVDVTDVDSIQRGLAEVATTLHGESLRALINNAGIALPGPFLEQDPNELRRMFEVNVFGALAMTRACLPLLGAGGEKSAVPGRVINVSSGAGQIGIPFLAGYAATKHALEGYSESLDHELRTRGIRVSVIEPAYTKTQFDANFMAPDAKLDEYREVRALLDAVLKKVMAAADEPEVVAEVVLEAALAATPKLRYTAGPMAKRLRLLRRFAPARLLDDGIRKDLQLDRKPSRDDVSTRITATAGAARSAAPVVVQSEKRR